MKQIIKDLIELVIQMRAELDVNKNPVNLKQRLEKIHEDLEEIAYAKNKN